MSSFKSTDIPYSQLCQAADEDHEFINLEELNQCHLNELDVLNQSSAYDLQNQSLVHTSQTTPANLIAHNSPQKDSQYHGHNYNQIMYQTIPQQAQYEHQLQTDESVLSQSYSPLNQNHYHYYPRNYEQNTDPELIYHSQVYPQQQMQNQFYYHINSLNNFNENLNSDSAYYTVLGNGTPYSIPTSNEAPPSETHSTQSALQSSTLPTSYVSNPRKRKAYSTTDASDYESDTENDAKLAKASQNKKNHSEIEKRRRNKMNNYITELSTLVPMCHSMSRKLDKLTVLRMAVQHMKTVRGSVHSYTEGLYKPTFLSDHELKMLILKAADGFMFVVGCDRGKILYMSESVSQVLNYSQQDLLGQSWFDIIHPEDVAKIKEQLSSSDLSPREKLIDARTMLPLKTDVLQDLSLLCPGARRSFFCRMKYKSSASSKDSANIFPRDIRCKRQTNSDKKYIVIHCTGHLKTWTQSKIGLKERESYGEGYSCNLSCLVAAGRAPPNVLQINSLTTPTPPPPPPPTTQPKDVLRNLHFLSRHTIDGKFLFIDQRATLVLGFLPQELLGTSMYEYYQYEDIPALAEAHKSTLQTTEKVVTSVYRFRTKRNDFVYLRSVWKTFKNPWTKEIESMMAKNSVLFDVIPENSGCGTVAGSDNVNNTTTQIPGNFNFSNQTTNGREMHRVINTHVEAIKIGRQIAEQALDSHRKTEGSEARPDTESRIPNSINPFPVASALFDDTEQTTYDLSNSATVPVRINGMTSRVNGSSTVPSTSSNDIGLMSNSTLSETSNGGRMGNTEGNDEAAMALIMSLLEADAGLGGPVDYTGLPWPLP